MGLQQGEEEGVGGGALNPLSCRGRHPAGRPEEEETGKDGRE